SIESINTSRQWIALHSKSAGKLYVDERAEEAILYNGKSLLPAGIFKMEGKIKKGEGGEVFGVKWLHGKGEVNDSLGEVKKEISKRREDGNIHSLSPSVEVIHRNRWVEI